jgi:hypothetical protein
MPQEEYDRHKAALASNKLQRDTALAQEADRLWEQVRHVEIRIILDGGCWPFSMTEAAYSSPGRL